jgi:hypothetical protein
MGRLHVIDAIVLGVLIRMPALPREPSPEEPCTLPPGVAPAPRHLITSALGAWRSRCRRA